MRIKFLYPSGLILCILLVVHYSCQKGDLQKFKNVLGGTTIRTGIAGHVMDENKMPVQGAVVKAGASTTTTDINGNFQLSNVWLDQNAGYIKVEKAGYFVGARTILPKTDANHYVEIELIPEALSGTFNSTGNSTITLSNGGAVQFAAYSLINQETSTSYSGMASVSAYLINPVISDFGTMIPGELQGRTTNHEEKALKLFGIMAVKVAGANKEQLNLLAGKTATLIFPILSPLLEQAPGTIPLWRFDETSGIWIEDGLATKQGNNYIAHVSHFSIWSCAIPFPQIGINLTINDQSSRPVYGLPVEIRTGTDSTIASATTYSDVFGRTSSKIPANKVLRLSVFDKCGTALHSQNIGPFSSNSDLNVIKVDNPSPVSLAFSGKVATCSGAVVSNGYVNIFVNGKNYRTPIVNGSYATTITVCAGGSYTASLIAFDQSNNKYSSQMTVTVNSGSSANTNLIAC